MAQGYYTLDEAAQILNMSPDELKLMARKGEIRSFQDRGTWRFRVQDIQELARQRGLGSDTDLVLGDALKPTPTDSPTSRHAPKGEADVFSALGQDPPGSDEVILVDLPTPTPQPTSKPASGRNLTKTPEGSGNDVRLVAEGSGINFELDEADEAKLVDTPTPPRSPRPSSKSGTSLTGPKSPRPDSGRPKSGVVLGPPAPPAPRKDSDSDVKLVDAGPAESSVVLPNAPGKAPTDSDIRLEPPKSGKPKAEDAMLTDEIDLDADLKKQEQAEKPQVKSRVSQAKQQQQKPASPVQSPFELTESGMSPRKPSEEEAVPTLPDSSSDFELTPVGDSQSPLELGSSDEFELALPDDAVEIGQEPLGLKGKDSGINLSNPADKGISLEGAGVDSDSIEFELSLDTHEPTPKPAPAEPEIASDSEFELTLDDSGGLAPLDSDNSPTEKTAAEKDIFETDFEVPALEDDSGSEALALDETSSDFDLALEPDDISIDDESGSQVVAVDESAVDEAAATVARPSKRRVAAALEQEDDLGGLFGPESSAELEPGVAAEAGPYREVAVEAAPAPWGVLPVAVLLPCVILMFIVGMIGFELVQNTSGYRPPGLFTRAIGEPIANMLGVPFRKS